MSYRDRARYYMVEYNTEVDQIFLESLVFPETTSILEIPAGAGRNLGWLSRTKKNIVAVDQEPLMVQQLQERIDALNIGDRARAYVGDMRTLSLNTSFDLILVPQGGFQLLSSAADVQSALTAFSRHLSGNGALLVDIATFGKPLQDDIGTAPSYFEWNIPDGVEKYDWTRELPGGKTLTRYRTQHQYRDSLVVEFRYLVHRKSIQKTVYASTVRWVKYNYRQAVHYFTSCGLEVRACYRNYERAPYNGSGSRMIFLLAHSS